MYAFIPEKHQVLQDEILSEPFCRFLLMHQIRTCNVI